jgi:hypothetical protein
VYDYSIQKSILKISYTYVLYTKLVWQEDIMDLRQLKNFLTIAEEGQITSAANRLQMAQPPLSQQLSFLRMSLVSSFLNEVHVM